MLIRAFSQMNSGTPLSVELKCGEAVQGKVRWVEGDSVGVEFDHPVDIVELLTCCADGPRPRMPRLELNCSASVRQDADVYRVEARDISQGGLKIDARRQLRVGSDVVVSLPGLPAQAGVVRWQDGSCYGITFNRVLPLPTLVSWLKEQQRRLRAGT